MVENFLQAPGVTEAADRLATSGPLGLALVVVTTALIWAIKALLKAKDDQKEDAKQNARDMLALYQKVEQVVDKVDAVVDRLQELIRELRELKK